MAYQAKKDWQYDEAVTEADMNRIEGGIEENQQGLATHLADYTQFKESKGQPGGLAELDVNGKVIESQMGSNGLWEKVLVYKTTTDAHALTINVDFNDYELLTIFLSVSNTTPNSSADLLFGMNSDDMNNKIGIIRGLNTGTFLVMEIRNHLNAAKRYTSRDSSVFLAGVSTFTTPINSLNFKPVAESMLIAAGAMIWIEGVKR